MDTKRFHNPEYKKQINAVRTHHRAAAPLPENPFGKFLFAIGLRTWLHKTIALLILAALVYLVYFAKFLMINEVQVAGADSALAGQLQENFQQYKHSYVNLLPQKNILFFSESGFTDYLLAHDYSITSVQSIKKKLPNILLIDVLPRVPAFTIQNGNNFYILNSDGKVSNQISASDANKYPIIIDSADSAINSGDEFLNQTKYAFLDYINQNFAKKTLIPLDHFEIPGKASSDLIVYAKPGFRVMFNTNSDPADYLNRFYTLWVNLTPDQKNQLVYFDLRFDQNAYGCYKGSKCD